MADEIVIPIRGADEDLQKALADAMSGIEKFGSGVEQEAEQGDQVVQTSRGWSQQPREGLGIVSSRCWSGVRSNYHRRQRSCQGRSIGGIQYHGIRQ
jgi:hypothetical protein